MFLTCVRLLLLTILTATIAMAEPTWQQCNISPATVSFPDTPRYKLSSDSTPVGPVLSQTYEYHCEAYSLNANCARLPGLAVAFQGAEGLYEAAARALLEDNRGAQKVSYQALELMGRPAAELVYRTSTGQTGQARFLLLDEVLLTTQATWPGTSTSPAPVQRFFASLAINP